MTTCYEYIRKKNNDDKQVFNRLENYFKAIQDDTVDDYHNKHKRKEEKKIDEY
jgi:hypothetical protein